MPGRKTEFHNVQCDRISQSNVNYQDVFYVHWLQSGPYTASASCADTNVKNMAKAAMQGAGNEMTSRDIHDSQCKNYHSVVVH